jgi:hypothetical protein
MQVTILGSCSVIDFPEQAPQFFKGEHLVDLRNGHNMEMDALPLLFLAQDAKDTALSQRVIQAIKANLEASGGSLWCCGVWGHNETHCRFSSVALRLMLLNTYAFEPELIEKCLLAHLAHSEPAFGGTWFFHDSIETYKQAYYKPWTGQPCADASANNMLILNTHLDTLITLLIAKQQQFSGPQIEIFIEEGLTALEGYVAATSVVMGIKAKIDALARNRMLRSLGNTDIVSRGSVYLLDKFYYRRLRYQAKQQSNVRAFSDGFLERDIRLTGPSLEYHVVNLWDMSRLLLALSNAQVTHSTVEKYLVSSAIAGLKYCLNSKAYRSYLQRLSIKKGVSNEVLESIAILCALGHQQDWMARLYLDWRSFAPPSPGVLGIDRTISGPKVDDPIQGKDTHKQDLDCISFDNGRVFVANYGHNTAEFADPRYQLFWSSNSSSVTNACDARVAAQSLAIFFQRSQA